MLNFSFMDGSPSFFFVVEEVYLIKLEIMDYDEYHTTASIIE